MTSILDEMRALTRPAHATDVSSVKSRLSVRLMNANRCEVCYESTTVSMSPCCGMICETCIWKSFTIAITEQFGAGVIRSICPYCREDIDEEYVEGLLALDVVDRWTVNRQLKHQLSLGNAYVGCGWCTEEFKVSEAYIPQGEEPEVIAGEIAISITCPHCYQDVCKSCGGRFPGHADKSCKDYLVYCVENKGEWDTFRAKNFSYYFPNSITNPQEKDVTKNAAVLKQKEMLDNLVAIFNITKYCPDCKLRIEKNGGCNHHTHYCIGSTSPAHFCWICLSISSLGVPIKNNSVCEHGITRIKAVFPS